MFSFFQNLFLSQLLCLGAVPLHNILRWWRLSSTYVFLCKWLMSLLLPRPVPRQDGNHPSWSFLWHDHVPYVLFPSEHSRHHVIICLFPPLLTLGGQAPIYFIFFFPFSPPRAAPGTHLITAGICLPPCFSQLLILAMMSGSEGFCGQFVQLCTSAASNSGSLFPSCQHWATGTQQLWTHARRKAMKQQKFLVQWTQWPTLGRSPGEWSAHQCPWTLWTPPARKT